MSVLNPSLTRIVSFNTEITNVQEIDKDSTDAIELGASGGTSLHEVAEMINDRNDDVSLVITDGYYAAVDYNKPVLHLIVNNSSYTNDDHEVIHMVI